MSKYRFENGNVYELDGNSYIFYCRESALTKKEIREMKQESESENLRRLEELINNED